MRQLIVISLVVTCLFVSSCSKESIRHNALKYESTTEINGVIEYYSRCYYHLPDNLNQIIDFLSAWKKQSPDSYPYDILPGKEDLLLSLKNSVCRVASYPDSIFLFFPTQKLGCCIYGHPAYWLDNPEKYPPCRPDYLENFMVTAYDKAGNYIFNIDYHRLWSIISDYWTSIGYSFNPQQRIVLYYYSVRSGTFSVLSPNTPNQSPESNTSNFLNYNIEAGLKSLLTMFIRENKNIESMIIPIIPSPTTITSATK